MSSDFFNHSFDFSLLKNELKCCRDIEDEKKLQRWASVHLIFHQETNRSPMNLAMIRRVKNENDPWSGHYAFPGGGVEKSETTFEAALRETHEEVGVLLSPENHLGEFYQIQVRFNGYPSALAISSHVSHIVGKKPLFNPCPLEVDEAFWFPLNQLLAEQSIVEKEFRLGEKMRTLPCMSFEGHTVWGLSYLILRQFLLQWQQSSLLYPYGDLELPPYSYGRIK